MNLARKILEGIHEVELQITPEFQDPGKHPMLNSTAVEELLDSMGWKQGKKEAVDYDGQVYLETSWSHPDISLLAFIVTWRPGGWGADHAFHPDPTVSHVFVDTGHGTSRRTNVGLSLVDIEKTATDLLREYGTRPEGPGGDEWNELEEALKKVGWLITASSGVGEVVYEHKGVPDTIVVKEGDGNKIAKAQVEYDNGHIWYITPPSISNIVQRANYMKLSVPKIPTSMTFPSKHPEATVKTVQEAMKAVGWKQQSSTSGSGQPFYAKLMFTYPGSKELIEIAIGNKGEIAKAATGKPGSGVVMLTPQLDEIVKRAKAIKSWVSR